MTVMQGNSANTYINFVALWVWSPGITGPVTDILFGEANNSHKLVAGSHWALYGIKG
jgi:hypothetical protein